VRGLVGAAAKGVIGGIQRTAKGIRDGWRTGSHSRQPAPPRFWRWRGAPSGPQLRFIRIRLMSSRY